MTITFRWAACALPLTLALGCKEAASSNPPPPAPPPTPSKIWPMDPPEPPPSQSEFDAKAAQDITEKNADAEFEKLKHEIEGGGGG
jgi:hypothetical protein